MRTTTQTGSVDVVIYSTASANPPLGFHDHHGKNIDLFDDRRAARRSTSWNYGICFTNRSIDINERIYIRIVKTTSRYYGYICFGFTSNDPATIDPALLPPYAIPHLTSLDGYWAIMLHNNNHFQTDNVLHYYVTTNGDVYVGVNGKDIGVMLNIAITSPLRSLWALIDIYGRTVTVQFVNSVYL